MSATSVVAVAVLALNLMHGAASGQPGTKRESDRAASVARAEPTAHPRNIAGPAKSRLGSRGGICETTFTGAVDESWENSDNWDRGRPAVPGTDEVCIFAGRVILNSNPALQSLTIGGNAELEVLPDKTLVSRNTACADATVRLLGTGSLAWLFGGTHDLGTGCVLTGAGLLRVGNPNGASSGATTLAPGSSLDTALQVTRAALVVDGQATPASMMVGNSFQSAIRGSGTIDVAGPVVWTGGSLGGSVTTTVRGGISVHPGASGTVHLEDSHSLIHAPAIPSAELQWSNGNITLSDGASVVNRGMWPLRLSSLVTSMTGGVLVNEAEGILVRSAGRITVASSIRNFGTVVIEGDGILRSAGGFTQLGGVTRLAGGILEVVGSPLEIQGGSLEGDGTIDGDAAITENGEVRPGLSLGKIRVNGRYAQSSSASYAAQVGDAGADRIEVAGTADLGGLVHVFPTGGYVPTAGDCFGLMSFQSASGLLPALIPSSWQVLLAPAPDPTLLAIGYETDDCPICPDDDQDDVAVCDSGCLLASPACGDCNDADASIRQKGDVNCNGTGCDLFDILATVGQTLGDAATCEADVDRCNDRVDLFDILCMIDCALGRPGHCLTRPCVGGGLVSACGEAKSMAAGARRTESGLETSANPATIGIHRERPGIADVHLAPTEAPLLGLQARFLLARGVSVVAVEPLGARRSFEVQYHQEDRSLVMLMLSLNGDTIVVGGGPMFQVEFDTEKGVRRERALTFVGGDAVDENGTAVPLVGLRGL